MPTLDEVYARKKEASGQVSTQTRTLAFGFLAIAWSLLTVHDDPLKTMAGRVPTYLILELAAISVLVLVLDMFQYVAVTHMAESAYHKAEAADQKGNILYDSESLPIRRRDSSITRNSGFLEPGLSCFSLYSCCCFCG
jgi:hypothetical protein